MDINLHISIPQMSEDNIIIAWIILSYIVLGLYIRLAIKPESQEGIVAASIVWVFSPMVFAIFCFFATILHILSVPLWLVTGHNVLASFWREMFSWD